MGTSFGNGSFVFTATTALDTYVPGSTYIQMWPVDATDTADTLNPKRQVESAPRPDPTKRVTRRFRLEE